MALQAALNAFKAGFEVGKPYGVTTCEWLADRVAASEDTLGPIVGSDVVLAAWALLHGLAQAGRARTWRARH